MQRCSVRVPASSANLGPGFDSLACALDLRMELEVEETGSFAVETELRLPLGRENFVVRGFERLHSADGYTFRIRTEIPSSGGLGTSAAAYVGGLLAADRLLGLETGDAGIAALAAELEGHPDNAAAAVHGGFVACAGDDVARFAPPAGLAALLVVPGEPVRTEAARAALPASVPLADAAYNVGRSSQLVLGLVSGDLELVSAALDDRLHQPYREHLFPRSAALLTSARRLGALGATISGAGPTVLIWVRAEHSADVLAALAGEAAGWAEVLPAAFATAGAELS
ncbi:MAG TPA: homoserine kinase [Solirubrobacteraceae bacterium]|nr:homoserine kinase [Solirubrobacteraceae bacterium]